MTLLSSVFQESVTRSLTSVYGRLTVILLASVLRELVANPLPSELPEPVVVVLCRGSAVLGTARVLPLVPECTGTL